MLLLVFFVHGALGTEPSNDSPMKLPEWNTTFTVTGVIVAPGPDVRTPFQNWYDTKNNKSRVDFFDGMVKIYQLIPSSSAPYGKVLLISPETREHELNKETCHRIDGNPFIYVHIYSILPIMNDFEYIGTERLRGWDTMKWNRNLTSNGTIEQHTVWVRYESIGGNSVPIPVKYEMKFYVLPGFQLVHYYREYDEYNIEDIDQDIFKIAEGMNCTYLMGSDEYRTLNPMKFPADYALLDEEFVRFKSKHNKQYETEFEHTKRRDIFMRNLHFIESNNRANRGFTLAVNHLADRTEEELAALRGWRYSETNSGIPFPYTSDVIDRMVEDLPQNFDWRLFGAVTPVQNQYGCHSDWAFSAVGAVEGALFLNSSNLVNLSPQALIDCSWGYNNTGCYGGSTTSAYEWIMNHGLPNNLEYGEYISENGYCHIANVTSTTLISGYHTVPTKNENALKLAIFQHGPVSIAIDASPMSFQFYSHGVYYDPKCHEETSQLNLAVLAVGFGVMNGENYWLVKNSWSNAWGNNGYILMSMKDNNCGVQTVPTYVFI